MKHPPSSPKFAGLTATLLFAWLAFAAAQDLPPALMVEGPNQSRPLAISKVAIDARVLGFVAETRMTLVFHNDLNRPLAGDLYFPLPAGATVSGYALDVGGVLVDGVVVDKDKGRQVFEKEARKGVDPGLVEWLRGNCFKTRVFPIPARGSRTVRVSYLSETLVQGKEDCYELPLSFKTPLPEFHLRLEVVKAQVKPVVHQGGPVGLQFGQWRDSFVAETSQTNASLAGHLVIGLPRGDQPRVLVEKAADGQYYFCAADVPADPRPAPKQPTLPALGQVTIFWDASGSRAASDHQRELAWLKTWFATYSRLPLTANLVPFRNTLAPVQRFAITNGDAARLLTAIGQLPYDGATQIGCLTNYPAPAPGGCYFLFTDGLGNFGQPEPPPLDAPLYVFTADQTFDQPFLEYLAQRGGGAFFPLRRMTDRQVLAAMAARPFAFLGAEGDATSDLYPRFSRPLAGRFTLAGRLTAPQAKLVLNYGAVGKTLARSALTPARADAAAGELLRRFWAQKKLEDLLVFQKRNESDIADLGKQNGLVTPFTSLLVLERLEQYVEHHVLPPASLPAMRAEYARVMEERATLAKREEPAKLEHILTLWTQRVEWWNQKFNYPDGFKFKEPAPAKPVAVTELSARQANHASVGNVPSERSVNRPGDATRALGGELPATGTPSAPAAAPTPARITGTDVGGAVLPYPTGSYFGGGAYGGYLRPGVEKSGLPGAGRESEPGVVIKEWDPKTPYLAALKKAPPAQAYAVYLAQRQKYADSPAFFLDCAEFFRRQRQDDLAVQVLSNIAELELDNAALLRVAAYRLLQIGRLELACGLFEQVLKLRPEEPQSFRDLALALARRGQSQNRPADYQRAFGLLAQVVNNQWDRFDEIEVTALMELNALWADFTRRFPHEPARFPVDERLRKLLDLDLRIVLTWDADMTDVDLHVIEPSGEHAMFDHNRTTIGGLVSQDFTQGYGPEEYCLRKAMHGAYKIQANYYGSQAPQLIGPVTVQAEVITHFGRPNEKRKSLTLRLEEEKETALVGEVEF